MLKFSSRLELRFMLLIFMYQYIPVYYFINKF